MTLQHMKRHLAYASAFVCLGGACLVTVVRADDAEEKAAPAVEVTSVDDSFTQAGQAVIHAAAFGRQHTPSPALLPDQDINLRFSHALHVPPRGDLECTDCHAEAESSVRAKDDNLPLEEGCFDCHDPTEGV